MTSGFSRKSKICFRKEPLIRICPVLLIREESPPVSLVRELMYWVTWPMPKAPAQAFRHTNRYTIPLISTDTALDVAE